MASPGTAKTDGCIIIFVAYIYTASDTLFPGAVKHLSGAVWLNGESARDIYTDKRNKWPSIMYTVV